MADGNENPKRYDQLHAEHQALSKEVRVLGIRLSLAQGFVGLLQKGYDALLHYSINFRLLPEYAEDKALDEAKDLPIEEGQVHMLDWMGRVERGIAAAIRRKLFKKVD